MLRAVIRELLVEGRFEDVKKKYPNMGQMIYRLSQGDPSGNNKYLMWMAKTLSRELDESQWADEGTALEAIVAVVQSFHKNQKRLKEKDINRYSFESLEQALENLLPQSKRQQKKEAKTKGADIIYDSDRFLVIFVKSHEAACHYGSGTKWCLTDKDTFIDYLDEGDLFYFIINKNLPARDSEYKIAVQVSRNDEGENWVKNLWDAKDNQYGSGRGSELLGDGWWDIKEAIGADARKRPRFQEGIDETVQRAIEQEIPDPAARPEIKWSHDDEIFRWKWSHEVELDQKMKMTDSEWVDFQERAHDEVAQSLMVFSYVGSDFRLVNGFVIVELYGRGKQFLRPSLGRFRRFLEEFGEADWFIFEDTLIRLFRDLFVS